MSNDKVRSLKEELAYLKKQRLNMLRAKEPCPWSLDAQDNLIREIEEKLKETEE